jgi:hypothetical protein
MLPRFSNMIQDFARKDLHVVTITDPHIANLPNSGYAPYDSGTVGDHFVKNPDGSVYTADAEHRGKTKRPAHPARLRRQRLPRRSLSGRWQKLRLPLRPVSPPSLRLHPQPDGTLQIHIGAREGSYTPWWNQVRLETFVWTPSVKKVTSTIGTWPLVQSGSSWSAPSQFPPPAPIFC